MSDTPNDAPDRRDDDAHPSDPRQEPQAPNAFEGRPATDPVEPAQEQRAYQPPVDEDVKAGPFGADRPHDPVANDPAAADGTVDVGHAARRARPGFGARSRAAGARSASGAAAAAGANAPGRGQSRSTSGLTDVNDKAKKRQQVVMASVAGVLLVGGMWFVGGADDKKTGVDPAADGRQEVAVESIDSGAMVNKVEDNKTWMAQSSNRLNMQDSRLRQLEGGSGTMEEMQREIAALKAENSEIQSNGQQVVAAYEVENRRLRTGPTAPAPEMAPPPEPFRAGPGTYGSAGGYDMRTAGMGGDPGAAPTPAEVKIINFMAKGEGGAGQSPSGSGRPDAAPVILEDSPEYLPPNSYAPARVIVGVDATAGVSSQSDPLPVVLRITGPARSVVQNGRLLTTRIQGCVINGAARGDLSSEKVYIKLNKMTCDQPGGRVAVSEVKGFISFGGKAGVRGRVVSREGALVGQALLAGIAGGFGRGFSANANAALTGVQVTTGGSGKRPRLGTGDILEGGLGSGVAEAGDMVSKYLIERAEQYQPVIEMPTGVNVEVVFLDGAYVRNRR